MAPKPFYATQEMATWNRETLLKERTLALEEAAHYGRHYNSSLPISKLPLELLLKIFLYHTERIEYGCRDQSPYARVVSQVCHRWRKVALGAPILWSRFIDCKRLPPKWFQVVLRRARWAPLKVNVEPLKNVHDFERGPNFTDANIGMALREVGNIGELDVEWSIEEGIIQPMIKHLQQPAPSLKRLSLRVGPYLSDIDVQLLPATIFSGITAPLQHLTLDNCIIDLQSPLYCHLISLSITGIPSLMAPSTSQWLDMLRTTPCLTSLQLESIFSPSESSLSVPEVHLPQLSKLYISGPFTQCSQFLYHIRYPILHSFCVLLQAVHIGNVTSAPGLPSLLKRQLSNVEPFQTCTTCLSQGSITLTNGPSLAAMGTENPFFEIELSRDSDIPFDGPRLLSLLLTGLARHTSNCEKLSLALPTSQGNSLDEVFKLLVRTFSSITSLSITGMECSDLFLNYLCALDDNQNTHATENDRTSHTCVRLPNLEDLSFTTDNISATLIAFLQFRKRPGLEIKHIRFSSCLRNFDRLEVVKGFCSSITLDGYHFLSLLHGPTPLPSTKEYFDYQKDEPIDPEIEAVVGP